MSTTIIVGGQYGSEGKGKIAAYLSKEFDWAVKSGGPNSGHTIQFENKTYKLRTIPSAFINPKCKLAIAPGAIINVEVLLSEIELCENVSERLFIDTNALIINDNYKSEEANIINQIGSTGQGVGAALIDKISRKGNAKFARDIDLLKPYLEKVSHILNNELLLNKRVLAEGSQGFGLSLHHGNYPFVTSRDTLASTSCGEIGLATKFIKETILVIRTYPIRVGGNSGPLKDEITWDYIQAKSKTPHSIAEYTTVTNRLRRVGEFDIEMIKDAATLNSATSIALNFVDYLNFANFKKVRLADLDGIARNFISTIEDTLNIPVKLVGTGPDNNDIIDLR